MGLIQRYALNLILNVKKDFSEEIFGYSNFEMKWVFKKMALSGLVKVPLCKKKRDFAHRLAAMNKILGVSLFSFMKRFRTFEQTYKHPMIKVN